MPDNCDSRRYTVISFAPVQGFIEKSRKLRDLYGASQILSYLSWKIVIAAKSKGLAVVSPAIGISDTSEMTNMDIVQGMPNRILILGDFSHNDAHQALTAGWKEVVMACRNWLRAHLQIEDRGWVNSWTRWQIHAWEVFWGGGQTIESAMRDLETRKLRRAWTVPNWNGESSSLSGHDAIAHPDMDSLGVDEHQIKRFYQRLAEIIDPTGTANDRAYINENERLSIPELIKRLVTYESIAKAIHPDLYAPTFREVLRKDDRSGATYWTGWFMGDGDRVGDHLKKLTDSASVTQFSQSLRAWGRQFQTDFDKQGKGRVIYAGGDDFLGVMYGDKKNPQLDGRVVITWLRELRESWAQGNLGITLSVGFVWAGHSVPQRDVLQHCREAEKLAKKLGRDRVTIRVVFNNGQFVQWTTPWPCLQWLNDYTDRDGSNNWSHIYSDLAQLKARHGIPPTTSNKIDDMIALELFGLYFGADKQKQLSQERGKITGSEDGRAMIEWIDGMIRVGWQLCSNS
jgi:CRISPR-associated protein Cmr2